jgi:hypothetical protein
MDPRLLRLVARERVRDLREAADARPRPRLPLPNPVRLHSAVTIRYAFPDDAGPLARLASLDSAAIPPAPVLLAEVEGELRAALSLATGELVADPFHPSDPLVELLGARARQLTTAGRGDRGGRIGRRAIRIPALGARRSG